MMPGSTPYGRAPYPMEGPPVTQPSSISVATGMNGLPNDPRGSQRTVLAAIGGALLGVLILAVGVAYKLSFKHEDPVVGSAATTSTIGNEPIPSMTAATSATAPLTGDPGALAAAPDAGAAANSAGAGTVTAAGKAPIKTVRGPATATATATAKATGTTTAQPVATPATPTADCTTPFWFDAAGTKHYKSQCLDK
jgi:serine/threonine-protein kinase